jgi:hypothetical protein
MIEATAIIHWRHEYQAGRITSRKALPIAPLASKVPRERHSALTDLRPRLIIILANSQEGIFMQITLNPAMAIALALVLTGGAAIAAERNKAPSARADDNFEAKTAGKAEVRSRDAADAAPEAQSTVKATKPAGTVSTRNTRPQASHHKDARACLNEASDQAIARCSRKYH